MAQFASKVEVAADPNLLPFYPRHWPAEVEVTVGGEVVRQRVVEAVGDPEHPLDADGVTTRAIGFSIRWLAERARRSG